MRRGELLWRTSRRT